jgi:hypothetical protein
MAGNRWMVDKLLAEKIVNIDRYENRDVSLA